MTWLLIGLTAIGFFAPDAWAWAVGDEWGFLVGTGLALFCGGVLTGRHVLGLSWPAAFAACVGALIFAAIAMLIAALLHRDDVDPQ